MPHSADSKLASEYKIEDRAAGMLAGVAVGDALGMPTEFLTPELITSWYGWVESFIRPDPRHPHHNLPAGSVTDDTDQTLMLAQILIDEGEITPESFAKQLFIWSQTARVSENRFIGPSTINSLSALKEGTPLNQIPRAGRTVGAAMRVAPLAIVFQERSRLVDQVVASCSVSHYTKNAISGAMAMAFALSESLEETADLQTITSAAREGAIIGREYGDWSWTPPIEHLIDHVCDWVNTNDEETVLERLYTLIGVDLYPEQLVPCAIGLALVTNSDPQRAMSLAANIGGDTDTLASMTGSICGGLRGWNDFELDMIAQVETINQLNLRETAKGLTELRKEQRKSLSI